MCEFAWMSFQKPAKIFRKHVVTAESNKIHPTQKPIALYAWILDNYAKCSECDGSGEIASNTIDCDVQTCKKCKGNDFKILDTHLGSGSSRIAAHKAKLSFVGFEIDKDYFDASIKRYNLAIQQQTLF
jgi:site-specific DNA-methyltransferase (adenine-specific)